MIDWISKKRRDKKRREIQEQELKKSLANKVSRYEKPATHSTDDFTDLVVDGETFRVAKEHITITGDVTGAFTKFR